MEIQELYDILVGTLFPKDITDHLESQGFPGDPEILAIIHRNLYDTNKANSVIFTKLALFFCAPSGARTLDPNIKSVVLYQLS